MEFKLENKNVFVSAASSGIGKAVAKLFLTGTV
ncbi:MAG: SDR family oxidoreductase [Ignavibacteriales bacterium]|nr:SDR family oxidoreductase [Ignavibacteriales bacterium]